MKDALKEDFEKIFRQAWLSGLLVGLFNVFEYICKKPWGITTATSWEAKE